MSNPSNYEELQAYKEENDLGSFPHCVLVAAGMAQEAEQRYGPGQWIRSGRNVLDYFPYDNSPKVEWLATSRFEELLAEFNARGPVYYSTECGNVRNEPLRLDPVH